MKKGDPNLNEVALIYESRERISVLETDISYIKESIHVIETNHLTHIQADINLIKEAIVRLEKVDSSNKPIMTIIVDIIKLVLVAVASAILALVVKGQI